MSQNVTTAGRHQRPLVITLILTGGCLTAEVVDGPITGGQALVADAHHMLTDEEWELRETYL